MARMEAAAHRTTTGPARPEDAPAPRGVKAVTTQWPFALVFTTAVVGVALVALGALKHGLTVLAAALLAGSVLRFVLPPARAGLLAVRRRGADVVTMALLGVALLLLALVIDTH